MIWTPYNEIKQIGDRGIQINPKHLKPFQKVAGPSMLWHRVQGWTWRKVNDLNEPLCRFIQDEWLHIVPQRQIQKNSASQVTASAFFRADTAVQVRSLKNHSWVQESWVFYGAAIIRAYAHPPALDWCAGNRLKGSANTYAIQHISIETKALSQVCYSLRPIAWH